MTAVLEPKPMFSEPLKSHLELARNVLMLMGLWAFLLAAWVFVPPLFPSALKLAALGSLTAVLAWLSLGLLFAVHQSFYDWLAKRWQEQTITGLLLTLCGFLSFWFAVLGVILVVVGAISLGLAL